MAAFSANTQTIGGTMTASEALVHIARLVEVDDDTIDSCGSWAELHDSIVDRLDIPQRPKKKTPLRKIHDLVECMRVGKPIIAIRNGDMIICYESGNSLHAGLCITGREAIDGFIDNLSDLDVGEDR